MDEITPIVGGYDIGEIDSIAQDLFQLICEMQIPIPLAALALCRTLTMVGDEQDLDIACSMIDRFVEIPFGGYVIDDDILIDDEVE